MRLIDLAAEFPREAVHWRVQGKPYPRNNAHYAMALGYIDARDVMDRLDAVCGPENWQSRYVETPKGRVLCEIGIHIGDEWVWKSDGAGDTAVEGDKGGISDSLKRAAVQWGIGRYLYRLDSPWVRCELNNKGGWKKWAEDPWSKVKMTTYNAAAQAQEADKTAEKPQRDPAAIRDGLLAAIAKRATRAELHKMNNTPKFSDALKWLWEHDEPKAREVKKALDDAMNIAPTEPV